MINQEKIIRPKDPKTRTYGFVDLARHITTQTVQDAQDLHFVSQNVMAISPKNFILKKKKEEMSNIHPLAFHFSSLRLRFGKNREYCLRWGMIQA